MSKRLPPEPKHIDELDFSDFLSRVPIREFNRDYIPPAIKVPNHVARWHNRRATGDPDIQEFTIRGGLTKQRHVFLTRCDWRGLLAPLHLVAPTDPAHERFLHHAEYRTPDELAGEGAIREAAKTLVNAYERSEHARLNPNCEPFHKFYALNYLNRQVPFLTRPGWRGLWVHEIWRTDDDMPTEPQNPEYRKFKGADEISSEPVIRETARKYLAEFDKVITSQTIQGGRKSKQVVVRMGSRRQAMMKDIKSYLSSALKITVRDSDVIRWALDNCWIHLLPDDFKTASIEGDALWGEGRAVKGLPRPDVAGNGSLSGTEPGDS